MRRRPVIAAVIDDLSHTEVMDGWWSTVLMVPVVIHVKATNGHIGHVAFPGSHHVQQLLDDVSGRDAERSRP